MSSVLSSFVLRSQRTLLASTLLLSIPLLKRLWSLLSSPRRIRDSRSSEHWTAAATKASAKDLTKAELNSVGTSAALTETSVVTAELFRSILFEELKSIRETLGDARFEGGRFAEAAGLFDAMSTGEECEEFLTIPAYERILTRTT